MWCHLCAPVAPIHEGRPVKIFTDNTVETIVFGNNEMNNESRCHLNPSLVLITIGLVRDKNMRVH